MQLSISNQQATNSSDQIISTNPYNINQIKVVKSPNTHIGPKFITSNLNLYLSQPNNLNRSQSFIRRCFIAFIGSVVLLFVTFLIFMIIFHEHSEDNFYDEGYVPLDWYYDRKGMDLPTCPPSDLVIADVIAVDFKEVDCADVDTCIDIIRVISEDSHFYLKQGHIFEGLGWNCYPGKQLNIVFLSEVPSLSDIYSFNMLLHIGRVNKLIANYYQVLPICCISGQLGPPAAIMNFLKTLVNFRDRDCIVKHPNCH